MKTRKSEIHVQRCFRFRDADFGLPSAESPSDFSHMPRSRSRRKNKPRPHRPWKRWLGWALGAGFLLTLAVVLVYGFWASGYDIAQVKEMPQRSTVFDRYGQLYSRLQGENRIVVKRAEVSGNFVEALLAREDTRFFSHRGIDPIGIARAVVRNLSSGSAREGASTLTQQLARNTFGLSAKTAHRKLLEAFLAARIEQHYGKDEILEHYMNRIYFGAGVYGIETAAQAYFGKSAKNLSLGEAALLAGIIRAPTYFSPRKNLKGALRQRDQVLARLVKLEKISEQEAAMAKATPIVLTKRPRLMLQENFAMEAVRDELDTVLTEAQRDEGGMKIYATIDPALQRAAEQALEAQLRKIEQRPGYAHPTRAQFAVLPDEEKARTPYLQGAVVVIDNASGAIRAIVGGRDFGESPLNRAREARRQIGSTFKPFVYAAAFRRGLLPGGSIDDGPIRRGEIEGAPTWQPGNSDGTYRGLLPAEEGLVLSRNTMSVRVGQQATLPAITALAAACGFEEVPKQPAIYLGAFEATLLEVTSAYSVFPNLGVWRRPYLIERVLDQEGSRVPVALPGARAALDPGVCWEINNALTKVMERGTGASVKAEGFSKVCAGKTGTTNDYVDAWFVGYTSSLTCGVWVGLDLPKTIVSKGYGATLALPVWADVMAAGEKYPARAFAGVNTQRCQLCAISNALATEACERAHTAYSAEVPGSLVPRSACPQHRGRALSSGREKSPLRGFWDFFRGK
jgi:penicillin-binding protein 1A